MDKPKNCRTCNFKSNKEGECWFVHDENDCQLIEIDEKVFNEVIKGYLEGLKAIQNRERRADDSINNME